jgi:hypothetical protein
LKKTAFIVCVVVWLLAVAIESSAQHPSGTFIRTTLIADNDKRVPVDLVEPLATASRPAPEVIPPEPAPQVELRPRGIDWTRTGEQSFFFLGVQHSVRLVQKKTRRELSGKFFEEWANSVDGLDGWGDGDSILTNYVGHPMMGAISGFVLVHNDPDGIAREFDVHDAKYWNSRLRAMGWAAFYSTQFELGPVSEATIGHVGKKRGTAGAVDLVMTPIGGFGWIVSEDAIDKHFIQKVEEGRSDGFKRAVRMILNPNRSIANVLRLKKPWFRDTRTMAWDK